MPRRSGAATQPGGRPDDRHRSAPAAHPAHPRAAELDIVEDIPDEYLETTGSYRMTPEQRVAWEADVRSALRQHGPDRRRANVGEVIDFETTLPSAVEELVRQRTSASAPERRFSGEECSSTPSAASAGSRAAVRCCYSWQSECFSSPRSGSPVW